MPAEVLTALYNNSDHLPVSMKLFVDEPVGVHQIPLSAFDAIHFVNPTGDRLNLSLDVNKTSSMILEIYSLLGQRVMMKRQLLQRGQNHLEINVSSLQKGMYIVRFMDGVGQSQSRKLFKR